MSAEDRLHHIAARKAVSEVDVVKHGPRIWTGRQAYVLARNSDDTRVLLGGVGALGAGLMWSEVDDRILEDETFADAPVAPTMYDDFGMQGDQP